ncbi:MAG: YraN family protein [Treponemataceae bacterium]|nr:YraN family protein [Treponemataceae bacterium]
MHKKECGSEGEQKAAEYLEKKGYRIIARNWRTRRGEIDIIAEMAETVVFAEVKTLPSGNVQTLEKELGLHKQKRIVETAKCFLVKYRQYNCKYVRFDVLVVDMPGFDPVYHIENAFSEYV